MQDTMADVDVMLLYALHAEMSMFQKEYEAGAGRGKRQRLPRLANRDS